VRCFIAIDVSEVVRAALGETLARLRADAPRADVRWVDPAQVHLTLKFLGTVADERVPAISQALDAALVDAAPVVLAAAGLGGFPSIRRPRVLWAGLTGGVAELAAVAAVVDQVAVAHGFPAESRSFRGHLTLGRVRSPRGAAALTKAIAAAGAPDLGSWTASEVVLYESRLRPTGALYVPISRHVLRGARR